MGCDIHGVVEVRTHDRWRQVANVGGYVGRSYDTFGALFGVRNSSRFNPLFDNRGFPEDRSIGLKKEIEDWGGEDNIGAIEFHSPSHFTVSELGDVDWDVEADGRDSRYTVLDEDKEPTGTKFGWSRGWDEVIQGESERLADGEAVEHPDGGMYLKRLKMTRRRALSGAWEWFLFDLLGTHADKYGDENVRVVVWFDN